MNNNLLDVHGASAQRSDPKSGSADDYPDFHGPQGDVRYVYNYVRCVRDISTSTGLKNIYEDNKESVLIYPNPTSQIITIESNNTLKSIH